MQWTHGSSIETTRMIGNWRLSIHCSEPVMPPGVSGIPSPPAASSASDLPVIPDRPGSSDLPTIPNFPGASGLPAIPDLPGASGLPTAKTTEPATHVDVWHHPDPTGSFRRQFEDCIRQAEPFTPTALQAFYDALEVNGVSFLPPQEHCNRYYRQGEWIFADFPYPTDRFFLACHPKSKSVYVFGNPSCLRRILMDLASISQPLLPLHGSAAAKNGKAICVLGNSGSGKTFALQILLRCGYSYLADEALCLRDGRVYLMDAAISLRQEDGKRLIDVDEHTIDICQDAAIGKAWILVDSHGRDFLQWFPCVAKQSYWWHMLLDFDERQEALLQKKVAASVRAVKSLIECGTRARLDLEEARRQLSLSIYEPDTLFSPA